MVHSTGYINKRILETMVSGILLILGLFNQNVGSLFLCGLLGF